MYEGRSVSRILSIRSHGLCDHLSWTTVAHSLQRATKLALAPDRVFHGASLLASVTQFAYAYCHGAAFAMSRVSSYLTISTLPRHVMRHSSPADPACRQAGEKAGERLRRCIFCCTFPRLGVQALSRIPREHSITYSRSPLATVHFRRLPTGCSDFPTDPIRRQDRPVTRPSL